MYADCIASLLYFRCNYLSKQDVESASTDLTVAGSTLEMFGLVQVAVDRYDVKNDIQMFVRLGTNIAVEFRCQSEVYMALKGPEVQKGCPCTADSCCHR